MKLGDLATWVRESGGSIHISARGGVFLVVAHVAASHANEHVETKDLERGLRTVLEPIHPLPPEPTPPTLAERANRLLATIEDIVDDIHLGAEDDPKTWTPFDVKRSVLDLNTAARLIEGVVDKLMQVGHWDEIHRDGWAKVKARLRTTKTR